MATGKSVKKDEVAAARRAGKTRSYTRFLLQNHTDFNDEEIDNMIDEIFDGEDHD